MWIITLGLSKTVRPTKADVALLKDKNLQAPWEKK